MIIEGKEIAEWHNQKREESFDIDYSNQLTIYDDSEDFINQLNSIKEFLTQKPNFAYLKAKDEGLDICMELIQAIEGEIEGLIFSFKIITKEKQMVYCANEDELYKVAEEAEIFLLETIIKNKVVKKQTKKKSIVKKQVVEEVFNEPNNNSYGDEFVVEEEMEIEPVYQRQQESIEKPKKQYRQRILGNSDRKPMEKQFHPKPDRNEKRQSNGQWVDITQELKQNNNNRNGYNQERPKKKSRANKEDSYKHEKIPNSIKQNKKPVVMNYNQLNKNNDAKVYNKQPEHFNNNFGGYEVEQHLDIKAMKEKAQKMNVQKQHWEKQEHRRKSNANQTSDVKPMEKKFRKRIMNRDD